MMKHKKSKNYLFIFLLLFILFLMPLIVAVILYNKNPLWLHHKTVNKGYLISSDLALDQIMLSSNRKTLKPPNHTWFLFYLTTSPCDEYCQKNLHTLKQIILALGKHSSRVKYGLVLANNNPYTFTSKDYDLLVRMISTSELKKFSTLHISHYSAAYYLADPYGKIILYYSSTAPGEAIYQDLSRLLTISTAR